MGTTKDPEGFRRHTAGRGDLLGVKGGGSKRRGCGLGVALLLAALALAAAARALLLRSDRDGRAIVAAALPAGDSVHGGPGPVPDDVAPRPSSEAPAMLPQSAGADAPDSRRAMTEATAGPMSASGSSSLASIRLLRGWSDDPLADAEVFWIGRAELARLRSEGLTITTVALEPVLRRRGRHVSSGSDGRLHVASDGCHLLVLGDGWTRELELRPDPLRVTDVRVFVPRTLVIDVVDWRGAPAFGIGAELWRIDALGAPHTRIEYLFSSPLTGSIRVEDVDAVLASRLEPQPARRSNSLDQPSEPDLLALERTRLRVALDPELAPGAWTEIDLAQDPLPRVRLGLPPLGELHAVVADGEGRPVPWPGEVQLQLGEEHAPPWRSRALVEGRATFVNLRYGRALRVRARRADGAVGEERELAALTLDDPEREVVLPDVAPLPRLALRPIHPDGFALPRTWCDIRLQAHRPATEAERSAAWRDQLADLELEGSIALDGTIERIRRPLGPETTAALRIDVSHARTLSTDAGGYLELPLPIEFLARTEVTVVVSLVRDGKSLSSAARRLERGEAWADMDLGSVPLLRPAPVAGSSK